MSELTVIIRTADQTRKAEVTLQDSDKTSEIIDGAVQNWNLPSDTGYSLVNVSNSKSLSPTSTISSSGIKSGDILEIQPVLVAG